VKIFILFLATTISPDDKMDATPTNIGSNTNDAGKGNGGDERRPGDKGARGSGGKDKGKGKMTKAQEEEEEHARKALEQRCEEVMSRVAANLAAEKEKIRSAKILATELVQALSEMEALDAAHPRFARELTPDPVDTNRSPTPSGPVGDEDDPVSEDPSERDLKAVYEEDENREGASQ
jgi:hypothetical protein